MRLFHHNETKTKDFDIDAILKMRYSNEIVSTIDEYLNSICKNGSVIEKLNKQQQIFLLIGNIEKALNHGGFRHFYHSESGNLSHQIEDALDSIGAYKTSQIIKDTNDRFPNGEVPENQVERHAIMDQLENNDPDMWEEYNEKFYMYEENFEKLLILFLKDNIQKFRGE